MEELLELVANLQASNVKKKINARMKELRANGASGNTCIFKELCFCLMTANYDAQKAIVIQEKIGDGFLNFPEPKLAAKLKKLGYRYPNVRAKYIVEARKHKNILTKTLQTYKTDKGRREWFEKNVKGLGFKESSHFLRNIGYSDCAIIDFHIIDLLIHYKIIRKPKILNKKTYLRIEKTLKTIAIRLSSSKSNKLNLTLAELDFYLWYLETGKILK